LKAAPANAPKPSKEFTQTKPLTVPKPPPSLAKPIAQKTQPPVQISKPAAPVASGSEYYSESEPARAVAEPKPSAKPFVQPKALPSPVKPAAPIARPPPQPAASEYYSDTEPEQPKPAPVAQPKVHQPQSIERKPIAKSAAAESGSEYDSEAEPAQAAAPPAKKRTETPKAGGKQEGRPEIPKEQRKTIPKKPADLPKKELSTDTFEKGPERRRVSDRDKQPRQQWSPKAKGYPEAARDAFRRKPQDNLLTERGKGFRGEKHKCKNGSYGQAQIDPNRTSAKPLHK
jgi:hypothetical protein